MVLLMLAALLWMAPGQAAPWEATRVDGVTLYVRAGQTRLAERMAGLVRQELPRVASELGMTSYRPFAIYAYHSSAAFMADTGLRPTLLGESWSPSGKILLDASGSEYQVRRTLAHELAHTLVGQVLDTRLASLPDWVNEGVAGHLSDPVTPDETEGTARLVHRDGVLTLEELDAAFPDGPHQEAAYLQSRSMVAWLEYRKAGTVRRVLASMAAGKTFDQALDAATGLTPQRWLDDWRHSVPAIMYWLTFLGSPVVYAPLALLLVWAALRRILRKDEPEDEDDDEEDEDDVYVDAVTPGIDDDQDDGKDAAPTRPEGPTA